MTVQASSYLCNAIRDVCGKVFLLQLYARSSAGMGLLERRYNYSILQSSGVYIIVLSTWQKFKSITVIVLFLSMKLGEAAKIIHDVSVMHCEEKLL